MPGHVFQLAATAPQIGTEIGMLGFSLGRSLAGTTGHITALHDHRTVEGGYELSDVVVTDAVQNPDNSGGPWITRGGDVVALAESGPPFDRKSEQLAQGTNGGVLASVARLRYDDWRRIPEAPSPVSCPGGVGNEASVESRALQTLDQYYFDINNSDYDSAYAQLDPANRDLSLEAYRRGIQTSQFGAPDGRPYDLDGISSDGNSVVADVRTRTHQDPAYGRDRPARTGTCVTSSSRVPESG